MITIILFIVVLFFLLKFTSKHISENKTNEPPSVPGSYPLVGNLLSLVGTPHIKLMEWANIYDSMFTIQLGKQKTLIVDDPKLMREIFSQPAFSGRADNEPLEYFSGGRNGIFMSEGNSNEAQRRFVLKHLRDFGFRKDHTENLIALEVTTVIETLKGNVNKPFAVHGAFNVAVVNSLWTLVNGETISQNQEALMKFLLNSFRTLNKLTSTGAMFSSFIRKFAPVLSGWKSFMDSTDNLVNFYETTLKTHQHTHDELNQRDLIDTYISEIEKCNDPESPFYREVGYKNLRGVIGDIFQAGSETTSSTLNWALLYLTVFLRVQEKLQNEIELVVGKSRRPCLADRLKMPYTEAVISEVLRKSCLVPLGSFHRTLFDTEFHGFLIRKGTGVIGNLYSAHHNPKYWDQPQSFMPERFLTPDGSQLLPKSEAFLPFQVGRRQCIGEQFAKDTLFLFIASLFQTFNMLPVVGSPKLDMEPIPGFLLNPKPYSILLQNRDC